MRPLLPALGCIHLRGNQLLFGATNLPNSTAELSSVDQTALLWSSGTARQWTAARGPRPLGRHRSVHQFRICDRASRSSGRKTSRTGRSASACFSYNVVALGYEWSEDNSVEIDRGWIVRAATLTELAQTLGIPAQALTRTVQAYNDACRAGHDGQFGRCSESLTPLQAPYHALRLVPLLYNTQGGPRRDNHARVLDIDGHASPVSTLLASWAQSGDRATRRQPTSPRPSSSAGSPATALPSDPACPACAHVGGRVRHRQGLLDRATQGMALGAAGSRRVP